MEAYLEKVADRAGSALLTLTPSSTNERAVMDSVLVASAEVEGDEVVVRLRPRVSAGSSKVAKVVAVLALLAASTACATGGSTIPVNCSLVNGQLVCSVPTPPPPPTTTLPPASPPPTPAPSATPPASPSPAPSPTVPPPPSPSPAPTATPGPVPTPSPCSTSSGKPTCMMVGDSGPQVAESCESCAAWVGAELASGSLTRCTEAMPLSAARQKRLRGLGMLGAGPNACAGNKDLAYNNVPGAPDGRDCVNVKTCDLVYCSDGSLRAHRYQKDGSVCDPPGCSKVAPTPCPPPPPPPPASPTPPPTPPPGAPEVDKTTGNYPMPPEGVCPAWFAGASSRVGIQVLGQRACSGKDAPPNCWITNLNLTEKSVPPFCPHAVGRAQCELWTPCQRREFVENENDPQFLGAFIAHPDWGNQWGICDKRTAGGSCGPGERDCRKNNICHDQAIQRAGATRIMACPPGVAPGGPGCSEGEAYQTPITRGVGRGKRRGVPEPGVPTRPTVFPEPWRAERPRGVARPRKLGLEDGRVKEISFEGCAGAVQVRQVKPVRGFGYSWVAATYGSEVADPPSWAITAPGDILPYEPDQFVAYLGGPSGDYTVRATGPCGEVGEVTLHHEAAKP